MACGLALAAFTLWLRLRQLGYTEFLSDQALLLDKALAWVHGGPLPLVSIKSSLGLYNFPLVEYLYALPLLLKPEIGGVVWLIALINLAGLAAAAWAAGRVFGWRTAWWATLLFAVNPWAVYYARLVWMQTVVPGFASLFFACLLLYFAEAPRTRYVVVGALSLSGVIQSHPTTMVLGVVVSLTGLCFYRRVKIGPLLAGVGLLLVSFAPFLLFEVQHNFVDLATLRASLGQPAEVSLAPFTLMVELLQSQRIYDTLGSARDVWHALDLAWPTDALVPWLLALAAGAAAVAVGVQAWRSRAGRGAWPGRAVGWLILLLWLAVPPLFFIRRSYPLQNYYLLYLYPAPFVLEASLADQVYTWLRRTSVGQWRWGRWPAGQALAALVFLPLAALSFQQARLDLLGQDLLAAGASGHQRIVDTQRALATARQLLGARPECSLVVITEASEYSGSRFALMREFTRTPADDVDRVRFIEAGSNALAPAPCAFYFLVTPHPAIQAWLAAHTRPLPAATIHTPEETWTFYELSAAQRAADFGPLEAAPPLGAWSNGLQLKGYQVEGDLKASAPLTLTAWWSVSHATPSRRLHFGTYLLTGRPGAGNNRLVTQADGLGVDSTQWQAGDLFQTVFTLSLPADLPPGDYTLAQALYFYPEISRLPLTQPAGDLLWLKSYPVPAAQP